MLSIASQIHVPRRAGHLYLPFPAAARMYLGVQHTCILVRGQPETAAVLLLWSSTCTQGLGRTGYMYLALGRVAAGFPADPLMAAPTIFLLDHRRCQRPNRTLLQRQNLPSKRDKMLSRTFMVAFVQTFAEERTEHYKFIRSSQYWQNERASGHIWHKRA